MSTEPTSTLTYARLIVEVARKGGVAYYGADGQGVAQVPINVYDLDECKRHVNNAIRMVLHDAPPKGWKFAKPTATVVLWASAGVDAANPVLSGGEVGGLTTLNATEDSFYESMEGRTLTLTGVGDFVISHYVSATQVKVLGDATGAGVAGVTWSITANGDYTLPRTFGGQYDGTPTYAADSNQGVQPSWSDETSIRQWRENRTNETGDPYWIAIRVMNAVFDVRRRWELMTHPVPDEVRSIEFPFDLHFDELVDLDEVPPLPFLHDETVKAACLAVAEKDGEDAVGKEWEYYTKCLNNSYRIDARGYSKSLGRFENPRGVSRTAALRAFRRDLYQRPTVTYN